MTATIIRSPYPEVAVPEVSLPELVFADAARRAAKPALIDGPSGRAITYGELVERARLVAGGLAARGFQPGEVFAIYLPNLPEYAVAFYGVLLAGGTNTTINPLYTVEELAAQLNDAGARYLLTVPPFLDKAIEAAGRSGVREVFVLGEAEGATPFAALLASGHQPPEVRVDPHRDLAVLPYSSGTTGLPKGGHAHPSQPGRQPLPAPAGAGPTRRGRRRRRAAVLPPLWAGGADGGGAVAGRHAGHHAPF
jgi:acyl-CoA synthetase (AMP-forming)/AMP-acid ligase II